MPCPCGGATGSACTCAGMQQYSYRGGYQTSYNGPNGSTLVSTATTQKVDMQGLNDRLAQFMQKIRDMCQSSSAAVDPAKYHEMLRMLEVELSKLKAMYEDEINKLRRQLEEANRQSATLANNMNSNRGQMGDIQNKLQIEINRCRKLEDDLNNVNRLLAGKDKEIADLMAALKAREAELDRLRPDSNRMARELEELKRQLEMERKARIDAENKAKVLSEKVNFDGRVFGEQQKDLNDRIRAANDIIQTLEAKLQQLANNKDNNITVMLQRLRDGTVADMRRFQQETESALSKSLGDLKKQMDEDAAMKDRLAREKANADECMRQMQARCNALEGENQGLRNEINALKMSLDREKSSCAQNIRDLESRLRDAQGQLMGKVKDFASARDAQASLSTEINQYRGLLDVGKETLKDCPMAQTTNCWGATSTKSMINLKPPTPAAQSSFPTYNRPQTASGYQAPQSARGYGVSRVTTKYSVPAGCGPGPSCDSGFPQLHTARNPYNTTYNTSYTRRALYN